MIPALLLLATLVFGQAVTQVVVGTETYIAVKINATGSLKANFSSVAYANSSGVYIAASPPTQRIACRWGDRWYNGTGTVHIPDPNAQPVCWYAGFPYPVAVSPMREHIPPFPLPQYLWIVGIVPIVGALVWRRVEVAGIMAIIYGVANAWIYPLWGHTAQTAVSVSVLLIVVGIIMILSSRAGE